MTTAHHAAAVRLAAAPDRPVRYRKTAGRPFGQGLRLTDLA
jgi:hypothetical protein